MSAIDDYLTAFGGETRKRLDQVRLAIRAEMPDDVDEVISYGIATFDVHGRHAVHFAGFAHHVGLYPTPHGIEAFNQELAEYPQGKGSVQFPHDRPLPLDLIRRIARHQAALTLAKPSKKKRA